MQYITYKEFKGKVESGSVDIPVSTICTTKDNSIYYNGKFICYINSQTSHNYFAYDEDGNGLTRGEYIEYIKSNFNKPYQSTTTDEATEDTENKVEETEEQKAEKEAINALWDKFLADEICTKYREGSGDSWAWNDTFYTASIEDIKHIKEILENN